MVTVTKTDKKTPVKHQKYADRLTRRFSLSVSQRTRHATAGVAISVAAIVIIGQLLYPADHALPQASIHDIGVGMATHEELAKRITDQFASSRLRLVVGSDKAVEYPLKSAGAEPDTETMIETLSDYPLWQRLLPGSIVWLRPHLDHADVFYTNTPLKKFADERSKDLSFAPQNARLTIKEGRMEATEAVAGSQVSSEVLLQAISRAPLVLGQTTTVEVPSKRTPAARTSKDLAKVREQGEVALAHTVIVQAGDQKFSPDKAELASWIVLATGETGDVTLSIDKEKIKEYLDDVNKKVGTPAGQTNINIVDGRETGRQTGALGRSIAIDALADQLAAALLQQSVPISLTAQFIDVEPSIIFNNKYTATQAGLQAYVSDIARSKNMWISVQQLDGAKWTAAARANESIPSGSTYKLFVAMVLFDRIDKGEIHWGDPMLDTTVAGCFERMTVASTNPCAESWIAQFGRQYIDDFIHARGFSAGTSFTTGYANQSTAADLTKFMIGLNDGTLVSGANRDRLLDSLGRHPYRYGIPTGSAGAVHDKVGFLWDYVHDTAIVNHPRGNYVMTIMTKGQSYGAIASVTREIERIMYP